ncbi:MAG: TetR/AcrR family transcriptional regulator [Clostridia bacterium]|nr:TetR/AcrR family transcriptional regulator [Clostridia bacterium]
MNDIREKLIEVGTRELAEHGPEHFSLRRVAAASGVSCAAPYKHFKDKDDFFLAIADTLDNRWLRYQTDCLNGVPTDRSALCLRVICKSYLRFLRDNPEYCALMLRWGEHNQKWHMSHLFDNSSNAKRHISIYAEQHDMPADTVYARIYALRALIYGTAVLHLSGDMTMTDTVLAHLDQAIDKEIPD